MTKAIIDCSNNWLTACGSGAFVHVAPFTGNVTAPIKFQVRSTVKQLSEQSSLLTERFDWVRFMHWTEVQNHNVLHKCQAVKLTLNGS